MAEKLIYGKEGCPFCDRARSELSDYTYIDVAQDSSRLQEMLQLSMMQRMVPVIVHADGRTQIGLSARKGLRGFGIKSQGIVELFRLDANALNLQLTIHEGKRPSTPVTGLPRAK